MNAVIAGACDRLEALGATAVGVRGGFAGLAEARAEILTASAARTRAHEPGTWLGTSRWPPLATAAGRQACREAAAGLRLAGLLVIGGHGSADGARALAHALPVAFVPATIDRDIAGTAATIGTDSAVAYALDVIERLRVTGRSLPGRGFVLQTLGAPHGHLADAVASAAGIESVLVPERPYDVARIGRRMRAAAPAGEAIAVMSEAIGDAVAVAAEIARHAGIRVHPTILGHAQRAATPSARDRSSGEAAGQAAAAELAAGRSAFIAVGAAAASADPL
jgi:6-phosphofructokinase 1